MDVEQSVGNWVLGLVATGGVGALALLARHAFTRLSTDVERVLLKLDEMKDKQGQQEGRLAMGVLSFEQLRERMSRAEDELRELRSAVAELRRGE